jgi:polygalacturonase
MLAFLGCIIAPPACSLVFSATPGAGPSAAVKAKSLRTARYSTNSGVLMICSVLAFALTGCGSGFNNLATLDNAEAPTKIFSVTTYGAKGDGVADDGPAIQRALNAAAQAGGGQVTFPCGEFSLASVAGAAPGSRSLLYLNAASGIQLVGQGHCSHLFTAIAKKSVLEFEDSTGISVSLLRITALNTTYVEAYGMGGGSAVRYSGVNNGNISQVEVDGASAGALYLTKGANKVSVVNNNVHDTYGSGVWEDDCGSANAQNCEPSLPATNNVYQGNTFTNTSLAAGAALLIDDGSGLSNALIQSNTISWSRLPISNSPGVHCIQVNNASNVSVLNNNCSGTPWDGIVVTTGAGGHSAGVTIRGNNIVNSGVASTSGSGIVVYDDPNGLGISGFTIASNTIATAGDDGIRLAAGGKTGNVQQGTVQGNTIQMVDQHAPGSHFGVNIVASASIAATTNSISCLATCTAAGVRVASSPGVTPVATANQVTNILGPPLLIQ